MRAAGPAHQPSSEGVGHLGARWRQATLRIGSAGRPRGRPPAATDRAGLFTFLVLRPLSDLFLWVWRLERRTEFLYRP
jgi:hypothetical protein